MSLGRHLDRMPGQFLPLPSYFQPSRLLLLSGKPYGFLNRRSPRFRFHEGINSPSPSDVHHSSLGLFTS
jgi:hypothetical protein